MTRPFGSCMTEDEHGLHGFPFFMVRNLIALASLLVPSLAAATDVTVVGLFPGKAVVTINRGAPRTLSVGQKTAEGVVLVSVDKSSAVLEVDGKKQSLELWNVVGSSFSSLGKKAEWRMQGAGKKAVPIALIVRYNVANPEDSTKGTSWLAIVKISSDATQICVTDSIAPGPDQNVKARTAADNSASKPCKTGN